MMNKFLFFFFIFAFSQVTFSKENNLIILGTKNLPIELNLLLEGLQKPPLSQQDFELLKEQATRIESYAKNLNKEEIFFIAKASFYKSFLNLSNKAPKNYFEVFTSSHLSEAIQNTSDPFVKWFLMALEKDVRNITKLPNYNEYLAARKLGKIEKVELRKIDKKIQLASWWMAKISADSPEIILKEINPLLKEILNKVELSFFLLAYLSRPTPPPTLKTGSPLTFFSIDKSTAKESPPALTPTVKDIIDSVEQPKNLPQALPRPSSEDWLLEDSSPSSVDID